MIPGLIIGYLSYWLIKPKDNLDGYSYAERVRLLTSYIWFLTPFSAATKHNIGEIDFWAVTIAINIGVLPITAILAIWFPRKFN